PHPVLRRSPLVRLWLRQNPVCEPPKNVSKRILTAAAIISLGLNYLTVNTLFNQAPLQLLLARQSWYPY
ncbi:MAG: hypothetical protein QF605_05225, partial [Rhodospirillales bacterium]|nr:hypothetical protein [Rhodospirillales bacterium]